MFDFTVLLRRFARDESGVFAVLFGLMAIILVALGGATVDYVSLEQSRQRAQIALDAAALALQPDIYTKTEAQLEVLAEALLLERIGDARITASIDEVVKNEDLGSLHLEATLQMPTMFVSLVGVQDMGARVVSEAIHGETDLEVAVALDLSGSMAQSIPDGRGGTTTKIASLKTALNEMIELLVQNDQSPTYSKMALVPYSQAVNVGTYANAVRGAIVQPTAISNITWSTGTAKTITGAARSANNQPVTITTSTNHGFANGDYVYISGVNGTTQVNNKIYQIATTNDAKKFTLNGTTTGTFGTYATPNAGSVTKCLVATCELVVTSNNHGLSINAEAYITGVVGMNSYSSVSPSYESYSSVATDAKNSNGSTRADNTAYNWINNNTSDQDYAFLVWKIGATTTNTFVLPGTARTNGKNYGTYTSGGTVACVVQGCSQYLFTNPYSSTAWYGQNAGNTSKRRHVISTCVTERDVNTFTDASYLTTPVGRNYASSNNPCLTDTILPLTATKGANLATNLNKATLHGVANTLAATGSTGGQIGVAWAWYLLSANFNGPWPVASRPASRTATPPVAKALVIMTDGEYNSIYRNGVIAQNSTSGSGSGYSMIGENANNGSSYEQTAQLCAAIKATGITIYTVGLAIDDKPVAQELMRNCASDSTKAYVAGTGQALSTVFEHIAGQLSNLRLSR
ncbi:Putative Flp pilus-assembly TadE/G-like [Devosia lucknowensis]|uniref:Putative Flp pilus-assembly TadE/G-like n=1 Tax=Devosia lucknowensis TaxID=1096929 RepID=A0A1Y6EDS9_9HYPH|nr:ubiquitin-activating E1 FCCH domain-containing protein [Devosia lucknowensis]SMQ59090.1 Putative Flp pilus-assembly TadE/G-like [Devosia lucknowensis]